MKLDKLFKKTQSGKVVYLQLYTKKVRSKDEYDICSETGYVGKESIAKTSFERITKGVNIGKKNETTPKVQAERIAVSSWNLQLTEGYSPDYDYVKSIKYNTFADKSAMPMLLNKFKKETTKSPFKPGYAQFKKDGVRNFGEKFNGSSRLKSRRGNVFNIQHILDSVKMLHNLQLEETFDGELYNHDIVLQNLTGIVKTDDPRQELEYHIYDIAIEGLTFAQRRNLLLALDLTNYPNIKVDPGVPVNTEEEMMEFHKKALAAGYEGSVYCDPDSLYDFGFRTAGKQKLKPRVTDEFECIDQYWNKGKMSKQTTLICKTKEGKTFHVKLKGTSAEREEFAVNFDEKVKGKMITVEYRKLTTAGAPHEGVGIAVRDYE